jgi:hypothetical protein
VKFAQTFLLLPLLALAAVANEDFPALCHDRAAIERVYYQHRLGEKPPFEQVLPPAALQGLVRKDLDKEAVLKRVYGLDITSALLDAEVQRINTSTRAPAMLAEIKSALGNDPARFANVFAKPILVERLLRERFEHDAALHAPQRRQAEQARNELLAARQNGANYEMLLALLRRGQSNAVTETTWQLAARPAETNAPGADEAEIKRRFGPNARIMSSPPGGGKAAKFYFEDLPGELQNVLRAQLRCPGDVSAVIEMPRGFLLYAAREKTDAVLCVAALSLPKRNYEQWIEEQNESKP